MGGAVGSVEDRLLSASTVSELKWRTAVNTYDPHMYKRSFYKYTFDEAQEYCEDLKTPSGDLLGAKLAMPKTEAAVKSIKAMFQCEYRALL